MILLSLFAALAAAFVFLRLLMSLATIALPVWIAVSIFTFTFKSGGNILVAGLIGLALGGLAYVAGLLAYARAPSIMLSRIVCFIFALPAGVAGYHLGLGLSHLILISSPLENIFSSGIGIFIFISCWRKISALGQQSLGALANTDPNNHLSVLYCDNIEIINNDSSARYFIRQRKYLPATAAENSSGSHQ